ncbi:helix-turn-helix domain-containing protein [Listeria booriae]|uniref:Helix-turn-helix domain-containing protein n=1 Tax=Listeria booriae TaxID=1552123 RepID=A0A7X0XM99_9LIST|nr:helix-turn-helix domain-containing protein [Listeria booriae]MBC1235488.1 helix-turn-helix domain-containing protein [Listeria booriae]MBC1248200.1 helix-turn-helix domain-containing protein [Listeria booriae]MBC1274320.1 helix-turn-helix domain-containing protein [Listeria booriae]MBC1563645.1 helix-turn-helix domain-containing protein [Listeria booriae]
MSVEEPTLFEAMDLQDLGKALEAKPGTYKKNKNAVSVLEIPVYTPDQIKAIRESVAMSQTIFARLLGVSNASVEQWESGGKRPGGSTRRLLSLLERFPDLPYSLDIIKPN